MEGEYVALNCFFYLKLISITIFAFWPVSKVNIWSVADH